MLLAVYFAIFLFVLFINHRRFFGAGMKEKITLQGEAYFHSFQRKSKNASDGYNSIGIRQEHGPYLIVSHEGWHHKLLKNLGLASELSTGHAEVDDRLFFATDVPDHVEDVLRQPAAMAPLKAFFDGRKAKLRSSPGRLWFEDLKAEAPYTEAEALARLEDLKKISAALKQPETAVLTGGIRSSHIAIAMMVMHNAFFFFAVFAFLPEVLDRAEIVRLSEVVLYALGPGLAFAGLWLAAIFTLLRQGSWLPMVVLDFIVFGFVGIMIGSNYAVREINIGLDRSEATVHTQPLVSQTCKLSCSRGSGKRRRTSTYSLSEGQCKGETVRQQSLQEHRQRDSKCSSSYSFSFRGEVSPWSEKQKNNFSFTMSAENYDATEIGDTYAILSHPGYLGIEWVDQAGISPWR